MHKCTSTCNVNKGYYCWEWKALKCKPAVQLHYMLQQPAQRMQSWSIVGFVCSAPDLVIRCSSFASCSSRFRKCSHNTRDGLVVTGSRLVLPFAFFWSYDLVVRCTCSLFTSQFPGKPDVINKLVECWALLVSMSEPAAELATMEECSIGGK